MKTCALTGILVHFKGTAAEHQGPINVIALRADMDGLNIPENNPGLSYKSITDHAHMCGHDGHMACLMAAAQVL